ncbi:hypothetical protein CP533_1202 [Ophiocordyceps camponoti-saundersi (nom. inval.)]|nr:hypothetical protein CP533_1202 [Ophiocordyceps camponoti-saundersi (nom. inval.)]
MQQGDIAIVGMACRLAGDVKSPDEFYDMLLEGRDAWSKVPPSRFNISARYHPFAQRCQSTVAEGGYFLQEDVTKWDAPFFSCSAVEAHGMDPQQRLLLEMAYESLESAGIPLDAISNTDMGCFIGGFTNDYGKIVQRDMLEMPQTSLTGSSLGFMANRVSWFFNLNGPSMTVDTACSSSLTALHLACESIRAKTNGSRCAFVGGASLILDADNCCYLSQLGLLSPDSRCHSFDSRANGFARGEGVCMVVIKHLDDAVRDGDPIRAVIRATGVNSDGRTAGIVLPSGEAQEKLMRDTYQWARLDPSDTQYVECHGTGTRAGDPTEIGSVCRALAGKNRSDLLYVGSVKANVGHTEAAAGVTALIKCVLAMERGIIPGQLNLKKLNPRLKLDKVVIPTASLQWPECEARRCSINSFGFGGTNAHVILEEARAYRRQPSSTINGSATNGSATNGSTASGSAAVDGAARVFVLSSPERDAIPRQSQAYAEYVEARATNDTLNNLAYTLAERRSLFQWRCAIVAGSVDELASRWRDQDLKPVKADTRRLNIAFVFTGQGAGWHAMGRELVYFDAFASSIRQSAAYLATLGCPWDAWTELMTSDESASNLEKADFAQPLCTVLQIALVDLLEHWGVRPSAVVGHSSGEIAAAYAAGALSRESSLDVAYQRGVFSREAAIQHPGGSMMAVGLSAQEVQPYLTMSTDPVEVGCINSPKSVSLTGSRESLRQLQGMLMQEGVFSRLLKLQNAYHSKQMLSVSDDYRKNISHVKPADGPSTVAFFSAVLGRQVSTEKLTADYWVHNLCMPVDFVSAFDDMIYADAQKRRLKSKSEAINALIEIGPYGALEGPIKQFKQARGGLEKLDYYTVLRRGEDASSTALKTAVSLWMKGASINLSKARPSDGSAKATTLVDLPSYRWNHSKSYWHETRISRNERSPSFARHDLIGFQLSSQNPLQPVWRNILRLSEVPWLREHRVDGDVVLPAAGMICAVVEALRQHAASRSQHGISAFELRDISIARALVIPDDDIGVVIYLHLKEKKSTGQVSDDPWFEFSLCSCQSGDEFVEHAAGLCQIQRMRRTSEVDQGKELREEISSYKKRWAENHAACRQQASLPAFYDFCQKVGLDFGSPFRGLSEAHKTEDTLSFEVTVQDSRSFMPQSCESDYLLHPLTLDAVFQSILVALFEKDEYADRAWLPSTIEWMRISSDYFAGKGSVLRGVTDVTASSPQEAVSSIMAGDGIFNTLPSLIVEGFGAKSISFARGSSTEENIKSKIYASPTWKPDLELIGASGLRAIVDSKLTDDLDMSSFCSEGYSLVTDLCRLSLDKTGPSTESLPLHLQKFVSWLRWRSGADDKGDFNSPVSPEQHDSVMKRLRDFSTKYPVEGKLIHHVFDSLEAVFAQEVAPIAMLMANENYTEFYRRSYGAAITEQIFRDWFDLMAHKKPSLRVIEIGAGTAATTLPVLQQLGSDRAGTPRFSHWSFTDISAGWFESAKDLLADWEQRIDYKVLDIEDDPADQGFEPESYDVVLAVNAIRVDSAANKMVTQVLHATKSIQQTLENCKSLLKPGGKLVLGECTNRNDIAYFIVGTLPGWWASEDGRENGPLLLRSEWDAALKKAGFSGIDMVLSETDDAATDRNSCIFSTKKKPCPSTANSSETVVLVVPDGGCRIVEELASQIRSQLLRNHDADKSVLVQGFEEAAASTETRGSTVIFLLECEGPFLENMTQSRFERLQHLLIHNKQVLWVTRSDPVDGPGHPSKRIVSGLLRCLKSEDSSYRPHELHLSRPLEDVDSAATVIRHKIDAFWQGRLTGIDEMETVEQNGVWMIPRHMPQQALNSSLLRVVNPEAVPPEPARVVQPDRPLRLTIQKFRMLETLHFDDAESVYQPKTGDDRSLYLPEAGEEVWVEVKACDMNFKDIMMAMGEVELTGLGFVASGIVRRIGSKITRFSPGDRVVVVSPGSMGTYLRVASSQVYHIPNSFSFEEAACVPVVYGTAYNSLVDVARLKKGETVLVHAASGGKTIPCLGQAIIHLAKYLEAEIFCTVGSQAKKQAIIDLGISPDHIFSSRDLSFYEGVQRMTSKRGVDVVINSLAGEALRKSWLCVARNGRFIEVGKKDIFRNIGLEMRPFFNNIMFAGVDFENIMMCDRSQTADILSKAFKLIEQGAIGMIQPITVHDISNIHSVFQEMRRGAHMGKLVFRLSPDSQSLVMPPKPAKLRLKPDATYILVGGLGGLGRVQALFMADHGARHLVFISRSGGARQGAKDLIATLAEKYGIDAKVFAADVANREQLGAILDGIGRDMPPIRGVIQGAMVLDDSLFSRMKHSQWVAATLPRIQGSWNLHQLLPDNLDFFVILSSLGGIIGSVSQANYAAGNTYMDALAHYRRSKGLAAQSIDLGVIKGFGYIHENRDFVAQWYRSGLPAMDKRHFYHILGNALAGTADCTDASPCQLLAGAGSGGIQQATQKTNPGSDALWFEAFASLAYLREVDVQVEGEAEAGDKTEIQKHIIQLGQCRSMEEAHDVMQAILLSKVSNLISIPVPDIDTAKPLNRYGVDSLVAVSLREWLATKLKADFSVFDLTSDVPMMDFCNRIVVKSRLVSIE